MRRAMKAIPMILKHAMITALLQGRKTQVLLPVQDDVGYSQLAGYSFADKQGKRWACGLGFTESATRDNFCSSRSPYQVGDLIWVRETFCMGSYDETDAEHPADRHLYVEQTQSPCYVIFQQDATAQQADCKEVLWSPASQMKKDQSRLTLRITRVSFMPVQEITTQQSLAEGCPSEQITHPREWFEKQWQATYGTWAQNPYTWCLEFQVIEQNFLDYIAENK